MDFDSNFRAAARHQTIRTILLCATVLIVAWWFHPVITAAITKAVGQ